MITVKAAAGALVRHPHTQQPLPQFPSDDDPVEVDETNIHWARLLRDGDIIPIPVLEPLDPAPDDHKAAAKRRASSSQGDQA